MENCVFCNIVSGKFDSAKIYEDDEVLAFLDVYPFTKGHCLVIPKKHFENVFDIDESVLQKIIVVGKNLATKIKDVLQADGIRLSQSNGKEAHQEVMHFHLHIIPRYKNDGLSMNDHGRASPPKSDMEELKKLAEQIQLGN